MKRKSVKPKGAKTMIPQGGKKPAQPRKKSNAGGDAEDADEVLRGLVDNDEKGAAPTFDLTTSRQFAEWLAERRTSLAFTTYQAGKVFFIGLQPNGRLSIFERTLNRCPGWSAFSNRQSW